MAISRRSVLSGAGATLGGMSVAAAWESAPALAAPRAADAASPLGSARERTVDLRHGWRFALVNTTGAAADKPAADDSAWRDVDLPHDWSIGLDPEKGPHTTAGSGYLPGGLGWYEKTFTLARALTGRQVSVEFDGVYMDAEVYFNGERVAAHPYGYTGFAADVTALARTDGRTANTLAVRVRNQVPSSRWYSGSGIYRDVRLVVTDPVHVTRHGVTVTTPGLAEHHRDGYALVRAEVAAVSAQRSSVQAEITATVTDEEGRRVAERSAPATLHGAASRTRLELRVEDPVLWSLDRPHRYTLTTRVAVGGRTVDETRTRFGLRWFVFDPARGFSLNGKRMKLHGVNLHHDLGALGAAFHPDAARRQLEIMRDMGVNALRTSHNPPAPGLLELCDRMGFLVQVEAFDCWRTPKNPYDYGRFFDAHSEADITEMVHAAKNAPSVVMWSIGNEIPDSTQEAGVPMARRLIDAVRAVDATRPVVIGSDKYRSVPKDGSPQDRILRMLDGVGLNYNTAASIDALHAKYPDTFFFESESSSSTSARGVYDSPGQLNTGENHTPGRRGVSSYDNNLETWTMSGEYVLKQDRDREFFAGQFVWTGIDYLGEPTPYADVFPVKSAFFGAVDTAGFAKDQFHLFRSQWSEEPMVHLVPMDWSGHRRKEPVTVWAYSNADSVELFLNGVSQGVRRFDRKRTAYGAEYRETTEATGDDKTVASGPYPGSYTSPNGSAGKLHLTWEVPYAPGKLVAVARRGGREVARDVLRTAGAAAAVRLSADRAHVPGGALVFVTADVTDARGVLVPSADDALTFEVRGGRLLGVDNGQQESAENYQSPTRTAYHGKALAIVRADSEAGQVTVTARGAGLRSDAVRVRVRSGGGVGAGSSAGVAVPAPKSPAGEAVPPAADASFSGAADALPAAMLDGDPSTGWSNAYRKAPTALLHEVSRAHTREWVALGWPRRREVDGLEAVFTVDGRHALPAELIVSYWDGKAYVPVDRPRVEWGEGSGTVTRVRFERVRTDRLRLEMTSRHPGEGRGFLRIVRLTALPEEGA